VRAPDVQDRAAGMRSDVMRYSNLSGDFRKKRFSDRPFAS
jgi:hypothetical protein